MKKQVTTKVVLDTRYDKKDSDTFPAKLRVTYQKKQVYLKTKYSFTEKIWQKMQGPRPDTLKDVLIELREIEARAAKIAEKMPVFSFDVFKRKFLNQADNNSLAGMFEAHAKQLRAAGQIRNAINYECAGKSLSNYKPGLLLTDIDIEFLNQYESWMKENNKSTTTISMYVRALINH